jgi:hypothetical protein
MLLGQICRQWREIALNARDLWKSLSFSNHRSIELHMWLSRSGDSPLNYSIECSDPVAADALIDTSVQLIKYLSLALSGLSDASPLKKFIPPWNFGITRFWYGRVALPLYKFCYTRPTLSLWASAERCRTFRPCFSKGACQPAQPLKNCRPSRRRNKFDDYLSFSSKNMNPISTCRGESPLSGHVKLPERRHVHGIGQG